MRSIIGVCTSPPEAERRLVQDARVSVDLGKGREGYTQRERERERCKTTRLVRGDHLRS